MDAELKQILKDFPRGPLCEYRKKASFNWKDMSVLIQGRDALILKVVYRLNKIFFPLLELKRLFLEQNMEHSGKRSTLCSSKNKTYCEGNSSTYIAAGQATSWIQLYANKNLVWKTRIGYIAFHLLS